MHQLLHSRVVEVENRQYAASAVGSNRVVHKRTVFGFRERLVGPQLSAPEILPVVRGVVKDDVIDVSGVVGRLLRVLAIQ